MEKEFIIQKDENGWTVPVWIAYSDYKPWDLMWSKESYGYRYAWDFQCFIDSLTDDELESYKEKYPVPAGWRAWVTRSTDGNIKEIKKQDATDYWSVHEWLDPPWEFDDDPFSIGWRMGNGEDYAHEFHIFIEALSDEDLKAYNEKYPAGPGWKNWVIKEDDPEFYDVLDQDAEDYERYMIESGNEEYMELLAEESEDEED